ncbi:MAG: HD-GYP domain-containing protein [candidate division NC10 bacterium]|nr:HD-GYP domain-containing protein [candidate division NC10 bacterium]
MNTELREAEQFLLSLNAAQKNLGLYAPTHPAVNAAFQKLIDALGRLLGQREKTTLGVLHDTLVLNGTPLTAKPELFRNLVMQLRDGEIQGITFLKGCTQDELRYFIEALGTDAKGVEIEEALKKREVSHILFVRPGGEEPQEDQKSTKPEEDPLGAGAIYKRAIQTIRKVFHEARLGKVPSVGEVQRTVEDLVGGILKGKHSLMALTMIKSYDEYLFNHSVNVGILATTLGETSGLDRSSLRELGLGALLHDLGKIHIPDSITNAARKLTDEEWEVIKRHPVDGVKMLEQMGVSSEIALRVVKEHHVRFDRTGYPTLAPDEEVHPCSMMVTIADTYDAMTTLRPYRGPFHPTQAIEAMKKLSGNAFDPQMFDRFIGMLGIYPPGTVVRLTTGETALVTRPGTEDTARPWVRIAQDQEGKTFEGEEVNLMEWDTEAENYIRSILGPVDPAAPEDSSRDDSATVGEGEDGVAMLKAKRKKKKKKKRKRA